MRDRKKERKEANEDKKRKRLRRQQQYARLNNIYETAKLKIFAELFRMLSVHVVIPLIYYIGQIRACDHRHSSWEPKSIVNRVRL